MIRLLVDGNDPEQTNNLDSIHHVPDILVCLFLSSNIGIAVATFHFLVPVYAYDLFGREYKLKVDGVLGVQFASGCLYQFVMSEYVSFFKFTNFFSQNNYQFEGV